MIHIAKALRKLKKQMIWRKSDVDRRGNEMGGRGIEQPAGSDGDGDIANATNFGVRKWLPNAPCASRKDERRQVSGMALRMEIPNVCWGAKQWQREREFLKAQNTFALGELASRGRCMAGLRFPASHCVLLVWRETWD